MRKFWKKLLITALAFVMLLLPAGCGAKITEKPDKTVSVSAEATDENLRAFLGVTEAETDGDLGSRFFGSPSERKAAERLLARYVDKTRYPAFSAELDEFTFSSGKDTIASQNVVVRYSSDAAAGNGKQIIIGAHYDNPYGEAADDAGPKSTGALDNATGVAAVMSLIDALAASGVDPGYDVVFVFFGAGAVSIAGYGSVGATHYVTEKMTGPELNGTQLMINLQRFGGDRLYLYCDEVETAAHAYLTDKSADLGSAFHSLPASTPVIQQSFIKRLPYTHYAMLGDHAPFMQQRIPVASLFSGNIGSFNLSDLEKWGSANMGASEKDTYSNLKTYRADYAAQAADAATLLFESLKDDAFSAAIRSGRENPKSYDGAVQSVWAYVGVIAAIVGIAVLLFLLVRHFEKKYPFVPTVKKLKIAVFGMEYENKTEEDVFVDLKKPKNPFDGY